jgi:hypothetical protein
MSFVVHLYRIEKHGGLPVALTIGMYPEDIAYAVAPLFIFLASWAGGRTKPASVARAVAHLRSGPQQAVPA